MTVKLRHLLLSSVFIFGCEKENQVKDPWDRLADDAVVLSVNGLGYTKRMIADDCRVHDVLVRTALEAGFVKKGKGEFNPDKIRDLADTKFRKNLLPLMIKRYAILSQSDCPDGDADALAKVREKLSQGVSKGKLSFAEIRRILDKEGLASVLDRNLDEESREMSYVDARVKPPKVYTEEDIKRIQASCLEFNRNAEATNAVIYANATNAMLRLRAGEDMAAIGESYFKGCEEYGEVGELSGVTDGDFVTPEEEKVLKKIKDLKVGGVSEVFSTEDGLAVYQRMEDEPSEPGVTEVFRNYRMILFHRAMKCEIRTDEELKTELVARDMEVLYDKVFFEALSAAKIEFPSGKEIVPKEALRFVDQLNERKSGKTNGKGDHRHEGKASVHQ